MTRRLRVAHLVIQPVLVWDDGDELQPGPDVKAVAVPLSKVPEVTAALLAEVAAMAEKLAAEGQ